MPKLHYLLFVLVLTLSPLNAFAKWIPLISDEAGNEHFIDNEEYILRKGGFVRIWSLTQYKKPQKGVSSAAYLREVNCSDKTFRLLSSSEYSGKMGGGKSLGRYNFESRKEFRDLWEHARPGSVHASINNAACTLYKIKSKATPEIGS